MVSAFMLGPRRDHYLCSYPARYADTCSSAQRAGTAGFAVAIPSSHQLRATAGRIKEAGRHRNPRERISSLKFPDRITLPGSGPATEIIASAEL